MRAIGTAGLVLLLLVSACNADPGERASERSATSPSPSTPDPSGSGLPEPAEQTSAPPAIPAPPRGEDDRRGRRAFGEYALQAWIHALNTNDPGALMDAGGRRPCEGCRTLARELRRRDRQGWHVVLDDVRVSRTSVSEEGGRTRVTMRVSIPESHSYHDDGTYRSTNPAHPRSTFEVEIRHTGRRFELLSFALS